MLFIIFLLFIYNFLNALNLLNIFVLLLISINEQMVFTGNFQHLYSFCNAYNHLLELYEIIHNIDASVPDKYFREAIMGYYIKITCNIDVKEVNIQTGLVRENKILFYVKDKVTGSEYITYEEYEKMIK